MRTLAPSFLISVFTCGAFAQGYVQGLVQFANGPTTLVSTGSAGASVPLPANSLGSYYFALLISDTASGPFAFTGVYATNTASAGRIGPNSYVVGPPGWGCGVTMFYEVAGWSANLGPTFNPSWLAMSPSQFPVSGFFGVSGVAAGAACGCGVLGCPAFPLFGGGGLQGFNLAPVGRPLVALSASAVSNNIVIAWTPSQGNLQSSPAIGPGATWSTVGTQNPTNIPFATGVRFFRVGP